jgi:multiple sugar transport system permease protein
MCHLGRPIVLRSADVFSPGIKRSDNARKEAVMSTAATGVQGRRYRARTQESVTFYLMVAPWVVGFIVFQVYVFGSGLWYSFTNLGSSQNVRLVGFNNYIRAFVADQFFWPSLLTTLEYSVASVLVSVIVGLAVAAMLNRDLRGRALYRTIVYLPTVVPSVSAALAWAFLYDKNYGLLNAALAKVGIFPITWLQDPTMLWSLITMSVWSGVGASMIVLLAGMQGVPVDLIEAAVVDGVGPFRRFWHITLPLITPAIFFNVITGLVGGMQMYTQAELLQGTSLEKIYTNIIRGNYVYMRLLVRSAFGEHRLGYACALSWILFLVIVIITLILFRTSDTWVFYDSLAKERKSS